MKRCICGYTTSRQFNLRRHVSRCSENSTANKISLTKKQASKENGEDSINELNAHAGPQIIAERNETYQIEKQNTFTEKKQSNPTNLDVRDQDTLRPNLEDVYKKLDKCEYLFKFISDYISESKNDLKQIMTATN